MALFEFGEVHPSYPVRVLNEREARAGAGILLFFGLIAFSNAFLKGDFLLTRIAILAFGFDFFIRVVVNPRYAPSLVLGRFMVRNQVPEYVGAAQKRFAWGIGLAIAVIMGFWVVGLNLAGPVAILGCLSCILLLFFETAFSVCVGCIVYNAIWPGSARFCPGGACEITVREPITLLSAAQFVPLGILAAATVLLLPVIAGMPSPRMPGMELNAAGAKDCTVPEFAKAIGHEEMWKLHNGCAGT